MRAVRYSGLIIVLIIFGMFTCSCKIVTIVPISSDSQNSTISSAEQGVDVSKYVDDRWSSVFAQEFSDRKGDLSAILNEVVSSGGWTAVESKYGLTKGDIGSKYNYIVYGSAIVEKVETESAAGLIDAKVDDAPPDLANVQIAIGPVYKGTAVRDSLKSVSFSDFVNQIDYANLAKELNKRAGADTVGKIDVSSLTGKKINFVGCFTEPQNGDSIYIIPVTLEVQ